MERMDSANLEINPVLPEFTEQPLRGELFSIDHLRQHAVQLAQSLGVAEHATDSLQFSQRFRQDADELRSAHQTISQAVRDGEPLTPEAEWLIDNFYVVQEHLREIHEDLPQGYFRELPKLANGDPRIYQLALELIIHTDSVIQRDDLAAFVNEFQQSAPLSIGETWALPIMLRLGLVENLRRLAGQMITSIKLRAQLNASLSKWQPGDSLPAFLQGDTPRSDLVANAFTVLGDLFPDDPPRFAALEQLLLDRFPTSTDFIRVEHRRQAANQVSIGNVITSMRLISALDWMTFFEQTNLAERYLRQDPTEVYPTMDPESRNRYRDEVERLAKQSDHTDIDVARRALERAQSSALASPTSIASHVGYWLVDDGREQFERELGYRPKVKQIVPRWMLSHPNITYFGAMAGVIGTGLLFCVWLAMSTHTSWTVALFLIVLAILPLSEFAVSLVNWLMTHALPPRLLPKLEFKGGVPAQYRTFVVVPAMLTGRKEITALLDRLEMHYVRNSEPELKFGLLTDFSDASTEQMEADADLVDFAVAGIRRLNSTYGQNGKPFYLFHRRRQWNDREGTWMGWERKRGKLVEFNRLLQGDTNTTYAVMEGDLSVLPTNSSLSAFPFVITLDADTQLPLGSARRLIGTLAHPLNRAELSADGSCLVHGYSILQPRVTVHLSEGNKSRFTQLFANAKGIDPYTTAASDVYQDLFGEGSFTGKGIYDVHAFETILDQTFEENQILSHDLIEGCHARVGLVTDIEVIDGYPTRYDADARRTHRWVRGDWQIAPWLFRHVPCPGGCRRNRLSLLSSWKIFDNLRRSLVPPGLCLYLLATWFLVPAFALAWSVPAWLCMAFPMIATLLGAGMGLPKWEYWATYGRTVGADLLRTAVQSAILIACLPHKAYLMVDAITRTLVRQTITRRKMLEWETAAATERRLAKSQWSTILNMSFVTALSIVVAIVLPIPAWPAATPWLLAWAVSPLLAHYISLPLREQVLDLADEDKRWLRLVAKETWMYFEVHVNAQSNWLPPDNLQEYPDEKIAERISPTNEGLFLVSLSVARDLGFVGVHSLLDLCERNLASWRGLPQLHGHFYNWYETSTLRPLMPRYVSTVDSGNLAASLLVMKQAMEDLCRMPVFGDVLWQGLQDTLDIAVQACEQLQPRGARMVNPPLDNLVAALGRLRNSPNVHPKNWGERHLAIGELRQARNGLPGLMQELKEAHRYPTMVIETKIASLLKLMDGMDEDCQRFAPWLEKYAVTGERFRAASAPEGLRERWEALQSLCERAQSINELAVLSETVAEELAFIEIGLREIDVAGISAGSMGESFSLKSLIEAGAHSATEAKSRCNAIGSVTEQMALGMKFGFLLNPERRLLSIGYNLEDGKLDRSHYDMLCSEARLSSHLAIAKGDVEYKHWFQLGRQLTITAGQPGLLSWGGTMFEFLMPLLFQRRFSGSLLSQACEAAVARQREYGKQRGVPWGVSESAFAALAINSDYSYQSFGVPGLGLKRGLSEDLVVAPYATLLALAVSPAAAVANLRRLASEGGWGRFGFYDAVDYSSKRVPASKKALPVRCYMAHHHAMSIVSIANVLLDHIIERRFHSHPIIRATEMLLQEAVPTVAPVLQPHTDETEEVRTNPPEEVIVSRRMVGFESPAPRTHLLSNGTYSVMVTNTGGGYSQWGDLAVNRWRRDGLNDNGGQFIYIRNRTTGQVWSATYQPTCRKPDFYEVIFSIDKAEYRRRDGDIETHLEIVVSPDSNVEHRQLKVTNRGLKPCELEITSYVEVTLTTAAADLAHPAFQKLFVETEYIPEETALLAKRRPRDSQDNTNWAFHVLANPEVSNNDVQYESSREQFLGRCRDPRSPAAMQPGARLSNTVGLVLDPIFSLRCIVTVNRHTSASLAFTTGAVASREEAMRLADQFHEERSVLRAFELAWVFNQVQLHHLHVTAAKAQRFQQLASLLLFPQPHSRGPEESLRMNSQGQSGLWRFGISGDRPILLVNVGEAEHVEFVRELMLAHDYWEHHGLKIDLVVLNTHPGSYLDLLQEMLQQVVQEGHQSMESKKSIFLLRAAQIPREDRWLLEAVACVMMEARRGWLSVTAQSAKPNERPSQEMQPQANPKVIANRQPPSSPFDGQPFKNRPGAGISPPFPATAAPHAASLEFWNGFGGFADNGREYHIQLRSSQATPSPWSNIISNPRFGCLVTESGGGYSWAGNSRQNKLTSWSNDPVLDPPSEILFLRDDETQDVWRAMTSPQNVTDEAWVQHGHGYSRFVRSDQGLDQDVLISVAVDDPVKFINIKLHNRGPAERCLSVCYYADFVLGVCREQTQMHLVSELDTNTGALLFRNSYHPTNAGQVAFLQVISPNRSSTGDRAEFLGRNGDFRNPLGLQRPTLSGKTGAGLDPCGALQSQLRIPSGATVEVAFLLGCGRDTAETQSLLVKFSSIASIQAASNDSITHWDTILTAVQVKTPNRAFDILVNRWLLYQVLSCRLWGRSAFYQSGGAYGFRDQLQDVMALVYSRPDLAREQILTSASRQFEEGDVQHWWHPPAGEGTRTRFSDDLLWLPYVVAHYVNVTGDEQILDEVVPYLSSPLLTPNEQERYELPHVSSQSGSLYEHCQRALARAFRLGEHGLPLMGCGDWNDGMNHVGAQGRGESVWVGWFLLVLLDRFLPVAERLGDTTLVNNYRAKAADLRSALEEHAWDGEWYRRAFFDDGTPLGSHQNDECQIDSIVQSWAVLAGADEDRTEQALAAVMDRLVLPEDRLVTLFTPPFDNTLLDPGYIKGYLPGVRENGGQYTHAVLWIIQALAAKGDADQAMTIFDFVNPILHAQNPSQVQKYRVEPYVVAADVYSKSPHVGRGGWTWYTGSASWTYRAALESILGLTLRGNQLHFDPAVPGDWTEFEVTIRRGRSKWRFTIRPDRQKNHSQERNGDAVDSPPSLIELIDDGREHQQMIASAARNLHHLEKV